MEKVRFRGMLWYYLMSRSGSDWLNLAPISDFGAIFGDLGDFG